MFGDGVGEEGGGEKERNTFVRHTAGEDRRRRREERLTEETLRTSRVGRKVQIAVAGTMTKRVAKQWPGEAAVAIRLEGGRDRGEEDIALAGA